MLVRFTVECFIAYFLLLPLTFESFNLYPSFPPPSPFRFLSSSSSLSSSRHAYSTPTDDIPTHVTLAKSFTGVGSVLLSQPNEKQQDFYQVAIYIYRHSDETKEFHGVILDSMIPFEVGKTLAGYNEFDNLPKYNGGMDNRQLAILLSSYHFQVSRYLGKGIYCGGIGEAADLLRKGQITHKNLKFFTGDVTWQKGILEKEIFEKKRWDVCYLPPAMILNQSEAYLPRTLWQTCRTELARLYPENGLLQPSDPFAGSGKKEQVNREGAFLNEFNSLIEKFYPVQNITEEVRRKNQFPHL